MVEGATKCGLIGAAVFAGILTLLVGILIPTSFSALHYYEYGFRRQKSTGTVDTTSVYTYGKHMLGPDFELKKFQADAHFETLSSIAVFTADRLEVTISVKFQYFLRTHQLKYIHDTYDLYYRPVVKTNAIDAVKAATIVFTTREFTSERGKVELALFKAVRDRIGGKCCEKDCLAAGTCVAGCKTYSTCTKADLGLFIEVRYFQYGSVRIPSGIQSRFMKTLILQESTETELYKQETTIVYKVTDQQVKQIKNAATEITQNATAQAALIKSRATANSTATIEKARSDGLKLLYSTVNLTNQSHKNTFDLLRTLKNHKTVHLSVDYQNLIVGPVSPVKSP